MSAAYYYPDTALHVCVDKIEGSCISGRIYCAQKENVVEFADLGDLVLKAEKIFDERGFPDAFQNKRSLMEDCGAAKTDVKKLNCRARRSAVQNEKGFCEKGECATFRIFVSSRCNSSWQGRAEWLDDLAVSSFSSALQFLRIADSKLAYRESPKQA